MKLIIILGIIIHTFAVTSSAQECVLFEFESDITDTFASDSECSDQEAWTYDYYTNVGVEPFNENGLSFIRGTTSCSRSLEYFSLTNGGTVNINFYINAEDSEINFSLMLIGVSDDSSTYIVNSYSAYSSVLDVGWHTGTIQLDSDVSQAYMILIADAGDNSLLLVDSIQIIPPGDDVVCELYSENTETGSETGNNESEANADNGGTIAEIVVASSFWNSTTISIFTITSIIIIMIIAVVFYELGQRRARKDIPEVIFVDEHNLPKPIIMPRAQIKKTGGVNSSDGCNYANADYSFFD